jgi:hypothetical protein
MTEAMPQLTPDALQLLNWMASYKAAGTTPGAPLHGPGGLLSTPGMSRTIVNAMIMPQGLAGRLPVRKSLDTNEIMGILTGLTAESGNLPTAQCADWPLAGQFKLCRQTHPFGQQGMMSNPLNVKYAGQVVNRGEFHDNVLLGSPNMDGAKTPGPVNWQKVFQTEYEKKIGELYLSYYRYYARYMYIGNPQLTAGSLGFMQYRGLDLQVNTGKRDAVTGVLCPAADSMVVNFNGASINSSGGTIYALMANAVNNLERLAKQLRLDAKWAIVMRYGAWIQISAIWPCIYATSRCIDGVVRTSSLEEQVKIRDAMRDGMYLMIEGKRYEVIIDDSVAEEVAAGGVVGTYESDFYFVPLTANGEPTLYWEYFDFNAEAMQAANRMSFANTFEVVDDGRYLMVRLVPTHTCLQVELLERPRLVLMMPFLAAKFQNIRYTYSIHERDVFTDETYFVNGGLPVTPLPYFYPNATGG